VGEISKKKNSPPHNSDDVIVIDDNETNQLRNEKIADQPILDTSPDIEKRGENPNEIIRGGFVSEVINPTKTIVESPKINPETTEPSADKIINSIPHGPTKHTKENPMDSIMPNCKVWSVYSTRSLTPHTLIVETFPPHIDYKHFTKAKRTEPNPQQQQTISHYFGSQSLPKTDHELLQMRKRPASTEETEPKKKKQKKNK